MNENMIEHAIEYAKKMFANEGSGHDFWHTFRVYNLATNICKIEGGDLFLVQLVALLHDVDDRKIFPGPVGEYANAIKFMQDEGLDNDTITNVCHMISRISYKGGTNVPMDVLEGKIVQDADRLDGIGAIGIARVFAYGAHINREIHNPDDEMSDTTINLFYNRFFKMKDSMNTEEGRKIAQSRHDVMVEYVERFKKEWNGEV